MSGEAGKYARFEPERRFLLEHLPRGTDTDRGWLITDRYIHNTRLRLRRMGPLGGGDPVYKLGQKEAPSPPDFSRMTITNIYLSPKEYEVFAALSADELRKRRHVLRYDDRDYTVDVFEGRHAGLILAEVGFETDAEMKAHTLPPFALRDVSRESRFTGGELVKRRSFI
jgi:CYTH domain-containing protein